MLRVAAIALLAVALGQTGPVSGKGEQPKPLQSLSKHLRFIENKGQWAPQARFLASAPGLDMWVTSTGFRYDVHRDVDRSGRVGHVVSVEFERADRSARPVGVDAKPGYLNYLIGESSGWARYVRQYASAKMRGIYPGVDLIAYADPTTGYPRYDLAIKPGASLAQVRMRYEGIGNLRTTREGQVAYDTSVGTIVERGLAAFDVASDGTMRAIPIRVEVQGNLARFEAPDHDPSKSLIVDPLIYSTFLGGSFYDDAQGVAIDSDGYAYVTGYTSSTDFPVSPGAYWIDTSRYASCYVTKLTPDGRNIVYSTYLGGTSWDYGYGIAVNSNGNAYVAGVTGSTDFPTKNAYKSDTNGSVEGFVTELRADGSDVVYSTYLGGGGYDEILAIRIDDKGRAYVVGETSSDDFPAIHAFQGVKGGVWDGFVARLSASGSDLGYSSYLGGVGDEVANSVAIDDHYRAFVVGSTTSDDFPTKGAFQPEFGGYTDVFITKISADGSVILTSSYLGGSSGDYAYGADVDRLGNFYVCGEEYSSEFPVTRTFGYAANGSYIAKLPNGCGKLTWVDVFTNAYGRRIAVMPTGEAYMTGQSYGGLTLTAGCFQPVSGGSADVFLVKVSASGVDYLYGTLLGGRGYEYGRSVAVGPDGSAYVAGYADAPGFPVKAGSFDTFYATGDQLQGFVARIKPTVSNLTFGPISPLVSGTMGDVAVYLPAVAPTGGTKVSLDTSASVLVAPADVTVPEGQDHASFTVKAKGVDITRYVNLTGKTGTATASSRVAITPAIPIAIGFTPSTVVGGSSTTVIGKVTLDGSAGPHGILVTLEPRFLPSSSVTATIPTTVTVPAGATKATFPVTHDFTTVRTTLIVYAMANNTNVIGKLVVKPSITATLTFDNSTVTAGDTVKATVNISAPAPSGGLSFDLSTNSPDANPAITTVKVPAGAKTATFNVKTKLAAVAQTVRVTAACNDVVATSTFQIVASGNNTVR